MITRVNILIFLLLHFNLQGQQRTNNNSSSKELKEIILHRNSTAQNIIHLEKITYHQSMDQFGWIKRIKKNNFGPPNFEKEAIEKIYQEIDSLKTSGNKNSGELYHTMTPKIVDDFFLEEDRDYLVEQIQTARTENWKASEFNIKFSDTISAIKISEPYYSNDKSRAIVFVVSPTLERAEFYRKIEGNWEFFFGSLLWIE